MGNSPTSADLRNPISITRSARTVSAAASLSRLLGCVRDVLIAALLGSGLAADAFVAAFRLPNLLRRFFGEGILAAVIVPVFAHSLTQYGPARTRTLGRVLLKTGGAIIAILTGAALLGAPLLIRVMAPGFLDIPAKFHMTVTLTRIMLPYLFFIGMGAIAMGILNSYGHFTAPALAPAALNVTMIAALGIAAALCSAQNYRAMGLAGGVLAGGMLQLGIQIPPLHRCGIGRARGAAQETWRNFPELRQISRRMAPTLLGAAGFQINLLVGTVFASLLPEGSIAALYYADRLVQLPLGIFIVALATVCLPAFARKAAGRGSSQLAAATTAALAMTLFLTLPAMVGLAVLRDPIVQIIFQRGAFDARAAQLTADALLYYAMGLTALAVVRMVNTTFFALQEMRVPLQATMVSVGLNLIFALTLTNSMGHRGLALAASLAAVGNCLWLLAGLGRRLAGTLNRSLASSFAKSGGASAVMGATVFFLRTQLLTEPGGSFLGRAGLVLLCVAWGIGCYAALARLLKCPELSRILEALRSGAPKANVES